MLIEKISQKCISFEIFLSNEALNVVLADQSHNISNDVDEVLAVVLEGSFTADICHDALETLKLEHELFHNVKLLSHEHKFV